MSGQDHLTIEDMLASVPEGAIKLFQRRNMEDGEERFLSVHQNWDYKPGRLEWHNRLSFEQNPWFGSRRVARRPIFSLPPAKVTFRGPAKDIVDFYSTGTDAFFLSERLIALFDRLDPGTMDRMPVTIEARTGARVPFYMAMPDRSIEAVDTARTNVLIKDEDFAGEWIRSITFPDGAVFHGDDLTNVSHFTDLDLFGWFWSRELIEAARADGIRGFRTISCATTTGFTVDRL